jgi:prostaglandin-E synthase
MMANHPIVLWAQRKDVLFLTIQVDECKNPEIKIEGDKLIFKGIGGADKKNYEVTLEFFKEIDSEKARRTPNDRVVQFVLPKKESGPFWPRLLKEQKKLPWLKVDFDKWKDEDESDDEWKGEDSGMAGFDMDSMMKNMGGGYPGGGDLGDLDSDEEDLPDLEDDSGEKTEGGSQGKKEEVEAAKKASNEVKTDEVTAT